MKRKPSQPKQQSAKPKTTVSLTLLDFAVLAWHLYAAIRDHEIGFNDADTTMHTLAVRLNSGLKRAVSLNTLESALYCCNLLDEQGRFWHPSGRSFDDFAKRLMAENGDSRRFNRTYNYFEEGKQSGKSRR